MADRYVCHKCRKITRAEGPTKCGRCGSSDTELVHDIHPTKKCKCGCGFHVMFNKKVNRYNDYLSGHNYSRWKPYNK